MLKRSLFTSFRSIKAPAVPGPRRCTFLLSTVLSCVAATVTHARQTSLLEMGPHEVGFYSVVELDYSRHYQPEAYLEREEAGGPRPIQINVWYPAATGDDTEYLTVGDYRLLQRLDRALGDWTRSERTLFLDSLVAVYTGRGLEETAVREALARPAAAVTGEPPLVPGTHPVVVYGPSMIASARGNTELFEYLASHGFIVASHPSFGVTSDMMDTSPLGAEVQTRDMEFVLGFVKRELRESVGRVALVGHSWGGLAAVRMAMRNPSIAAVVSLDSSVETWRNLVMSAPHYDPVNLRTPYLHIETADNDTLGFYESVVFADKYRVSFPTLEHFDVVSSRHRPATSEKDTLYAINNRIILAFLSAYLKQDRTGLDASIGEVTDGDLDVSMSFTPGNAPPPTEAELVNMFLSGSGAEAEAAIREAKRTSAGAYSEETLLRVGELILWSWDHFEAAERVFRFVLELYPESATAYEMLGNVYWGLGDREQMAANFARSLELDPTNERVRAILRRLRD